MFTKSGEKVARPSSHAFHVMIQAMYFNLIFLEQTDEDTQYAFVVKDDTSSYVSLGSSPLA